MQTTLLCIITTCTQGEYQTKILNKAWNNCSGFTQESLICLIGWIFFGTSMLLYTCEWYYYLICWKQWKVPIWKIGLDVFITFFTIDILIENIGKLISYFFKALENKNLCLELEVFSLFPLESLQTFITQCFGEDFNF